MAVSDPSASFADRYAGYQGTPSWLPDEHQLTSAWTAVPVDHDPWAGQPEVPDFAAYRGQPNNYAGTGEWPIASSLPAGTAANQAARGPSPWQAPRQLQDLGQDYGQSPVEPRNFLQRAGDYIANSDLGQAFDVMRNADWGVHRDAPLGRSNPNLWSNVGSGLVHGVVDPAVRLWNYPRDEINILSQMQPGGPVPTEAVDATTQAVIDAVTTLPGVKSPGSLNVFAGITSRTADRNALDLAARMRRRGVPSETIHELTGFFQTGDNKWRYEVSDKGSRLKTEALDKQMPESSGFGSEPQYNVPSKFFGFGTVRLKEILDHPELYKAYPDLADMEVKRSADQTYRAQYNPLSNTISMRPDTAARMHTALLHEVQHAIQNRELFANGASLRSFLPQEFVEFAKDYKEGDEIPPKFLKMYDDAVEQYKRSAGEVEARNVQTRFESGDDSSFPPSTADRPPSEQHIIGYESRAVPVDYDPWDVKNYRGTPFDQPDISGLWGFGRKNEQPKTTVEQAIKQYGGDHNFWGPVYDVASQRSWWDSPGASQNSKVGALLDTALHHKDLDDYKMGNLWGGAPRTAPWPLNVKTYGERSFDAVREKYPDWFGGKYHDSTYHEYLNDQDKIWDDFRESNRQWEQSHRQWQQEQAEQKQRAYDRGDDINWEDVGSARERAQRGQDERNKWWDENQPGWRDNLSEEAKRRAAKDAFEKIPNHLRIMKTMQLFRRPGTPGEKEAARAALHRMGIEDPDNIFIPGLDL